MLTDERIKEIAQKAWSECIDVFGNENSSIEDIIESAIRQALKEAQEWVSVDERLPNIPDDSQEVDVWCVNEDGLMDRGIYYRSGDNNCFDMLNVAFWKYDQWPTPPTADKGEG